MDPSLDCSGNADMNAAMVRVYKWLLNTNAQAANITSKIVVAHLPGESSYWFQHDASTDAWLRSTFPKANVTQINACDNGRCACLPTHV
jgi:hypothetical protein